MQHTEIFIFILKMKTEILSYLPRINWSLWLLWILLQASQLPGLVERYANDLCLFNDKRDLVKDNMTINSILILVSLFMPRERNQQLNSSVFSKTLSQSKLLSIHIFRRILFSCSGRCFRIKLILTLNILCKPNLNSPYVPPKTFGLKSSMWHQNLGNPSFSELHEGGKFSPSSSQHLLCKCLIHTHWMHIERTRTST